MTDLATRAALTLSTLVLSATFFGTQTVPAQQSTRVPQFENGAVNVWRSTIVPNAPLTLHRHDHPRIIVALEGGTMHLVDSSGTIEVHPWQTGNAYWLPAMPPGASHTDVNPTTKPIDVMVIELKHED